MCCFSPAAGGQRLLPGLLRALRWEGHLGLGFCLGSAPLSSASPGTWHQPPCTVASQTPVSSTSTTANSASLSRFSQLLQVRKPVPGKPPSRRAVACLCGLHMSSGCQVQGPIHCCAGASVLSVASSVSFSQSGHSVGPVGRFPSSIPYGPPAPSLVWALSIAARGLI